MEPPDPGPLPQAAPPDAPPPDPLPILVAADGAAEAVPPAPPPYRLYAAGSVALAAFLGGFLPGVILIAVNYRRLGRRRAAAVTVAGGLLTCAGLAGAIAFIPDA